MHPLPQLTIRLAEHDDCVVMNEIRADSIIELCRPDHGDDPATVLRWVNNQSVETFRQLLVRPDVTLIVAECESVVVAVGGINGDKVTLNYVHPDHRFRGISKALMVALEAAMVAGGVVRGRLDSTATARDFYRGIGWIDEDGGTPEAGYPMSKTLQGSG
ncbi:GNAT family N-acetyltransferase [Devosia sp. SL43]|uniref:GNAT family N-acetyltransferase n=1 Tax=Devosia sp. SL43 TaxID=2806348 RepID=UPI001F4546B2|nr:GNAT family N-acetyltransferase [Devosia sp. SL43]UJW84297.1 GNAT family N-acetyltransferase [Devosia sp. SL43]